MNSLENKITQNQINVEEQMLEKMDEVIKKYTEKSKPTFRLKMETNQRNKIKKLIKKTA